MFFFFFNATATTEIYTLSLHDALPIYAAEVSAVIAANPRPSPHRGTIPPEARVVLDQLAACGTPGQLREQLEPWDHAVDVVTFMLPPRMPWDTIEATLRDAARAA